MDKIPIMDHIECWVNLMFSNFISHVNGAVEIHHWVSFPVVSVSLFANLLHPIHPNDFFM